MAGKRLVPGRGILAEDGFSVCHKGACTSRDMRPHAATRYFLLSALVPMIAPAFYMEFSSRHRTCSCPWSGGNRRLIRSQ